MNIFDLLLLLVLVIAIIGGYRVGLLARASALIGLIVGLIAATWTVPWLLGLMETMPPWSRFLAGLFTLALTVSVLVSVFQSVGRRLRAGVSATPLSGIDRLAGSAVSVVVVIGLVWFLLPAVSDIPGSVAREVRGSTAGSVIRTFAPTPPDVTRTLRAAIDSSRFPEVWADLRPAPQTGPPPEQIPVDQAIVEAATESTVGVRANGCGRRYEGSGVTLADDTVVTNAHVIAGADEISVRRPDGTQRLATAVVFDPERDLAVLEVNDLGQTPLPMASAELDADGASIGYPGGQSQPRVAPLRTDDRRPALGRDIYGADAADRSVLFLSAELQQGDSGSPVIDTDGNVTGIVFAISPDQASTAYALDLTEVEEVLDAPHEPGQTGRCIG